jgi:uncharacterized membrane protein
MALVEVEPVFDIAVVQVVLFELRSILYPTTVAPYVDAGLAQVNLALAVLGVAELQASEATSDLTALAAVMLAAFAAWAGMKSVLAKMAATMPAKKRLDLITGLAY